jgi:hypothetical protein
LIASRRRPRLIKPIVLPAIMLKRTALSFIAIALLCLTANAQRAEITVTLNEQFFDALLEGIFKHTPPGDFPLAALPTADADAAVFRNASFKAAPACAQAIQIRYESGGTKTAVRFRDGRITAPLAFSGNYEPPFVGCVPFAGIAETEISLRFDERSQRLLAEIKLQSVSLNGTGGVGGSLVARMLQGSIDRRVNPIEILRLEKLAFLVPIQNSGNLQMRAVAVRPEVIQQAINIHVLYEFSKGA